MVNALYDISWLGLMQASKQTKSGLGRAIEETGKALASAEGCSIRLCASASSEAHQGAKEWLSSQGGALNSSFVSQPWISAGMEASVRRLQAWPRAGLQGFSREVFLKFAYKGLTMAGGGGDFIPPSSLAWAHVYHAQYLSVPERLLKVKHLKRFSTVYDLIPLKLPELCFDGSAAYLGGIVNSIQPSDHVICISEFTKSDLCEYRKDLDPGRVSVAHLGASSAFHPCKEAGAIERMRAKYAIPEGPYLLSVSTVAPHKNFARLIESFGTMIHEQGIRDLSLVITGGSGWKRERIEQALGKWNVGHNRIVMTGFVADADLPALYGGAQAFIFPSLYEGFGLPVLEAMQCGTPVICSNSTSIPEVGGDAVLYFDPTNGDELSAAMLRVYNEETLRKELAGKSLVQASRFSWERCARDTVAAYSKALQE